MKHVGKGRERTGPEKRVLSTERQKTITTHCIGMRK
jgi:hypothetical protein